MLTERLALYEYLPNHRVGCGYEYDGKLLSRLQKAPRSFRGYAVPFLDYKLREHVAVFFGKDVRLFVDLGAGPAELVPTPASITGIAFWRKAEYQTTSGPATVTVFTPPLRYLANDGMFPEDIEPMIHLLRVLSDPVERQRFVRKFATGSWENA